VGTEERLAQYLKTVKREKTERGVGDTRVEALMSELDLPWRPDGEVWTIASDVGEVTLGLSPDDQVLSLWQAIMPVPPGKPKKHGDLFHELLMVNAQTQGACLAVTEIGTDEWVMVIARLNAPTLDKEELAMALGDIFATLKMFDPSDAP